MSQQKQPRQPWRMLSAARVKVVYNWVHYAPNCLVQQPNHTESDKGCEVKCPHGSNGWRIQSSIATG